MGKSIKSSSGFTGKGFKFDEAEAQQALEKKRQQKAALGLQDSDDEEDVVEGDIDQEIENMLGTSSVSVKPVVVPPPVVPIVPGSTLDLSNKAKTVGEKLELAKKLASRLTVSQNPAPSSFGSTPLARAAASAAHTEAILRGDAASLGNFAQAVNAKSIAEERAEKINAKLNYNPSQASDYNESGQLMGADATSGLSLNQPRIEQELNINDVPQQARWRVTSKEAIASIAEYSEAGITVRGTYFPPGKEPQFGERKLYLAIEGTTELSVSKAKAEIIRLIKEELIKMVSRFEFCRLFNDKVFLFSVTV